VALLYYAAAVRPQIVLFSDVIVIGRGLVIAPADFLHRAESQQKRGYRGSDKLSGLLQVKLGTRLLFNLDNEPNAGNDGTNDFTILTATGSTALISAIDNATDLNVPEPSASLFGLVTALELVVRRRRKFLLGESSGQ